MTTSPGEAYRSARACVLAGRWREAAALLAPCVDDRADVGVLALAAETALAFGAYAEACELARRAVASPAVALDDVGVLQAARILRRLELPMALEALLARHADGIRDPAVAAELAILASSAALFGPASGLSQALLARAPQGADAHYVAGLLAMFDGDRVRSLDHLATALRVEPRMSNAHWLVAMQAGDADAAAHVDAMRRALPGIRPATEAEAYVRYALHRRLHVLGRYDEAWTELARGHAVARQLTPYDAGGDRRLFQALHRVRPPDSLPASADGAVRMIFIVGMFRSGTSLIERVLTGHPDVVDGGETYQFSAALREAADMDGVGALDLALLERLPRVDLRAVRERVLSYARWRAAGRGWLTEKLPSNHLNVPWILAALPEATVVHLRRDPIDTCFSNLRTYFRGAAPYATAMEDVADYCLAYRRLMARWNELLPGRIVDIDYAEFVASPEDVARRLLDACGLRYLPDVLDIARSPGRTTTASAAEMRSGILRDRHGAWHPYRRQLQPMLERLGGAAV